MKTKLQSAFAAVLAVLTILAVLDLTHIAPLLGEFLPERVVKAIAILPTVAAAILHAVNAVKPKDDDGFAVGRIVRLLPILFAVSVFSSCAAFTSAATGEPIPTTPVQREGGKPFDVATSDILRAEAWPPGTAWGLYDAGLAASRVRTVIDAGK